MSVASYEVATGQVVGTVEEHTPDEVRGLLEAAESAAPALARTSPAIRRAWLHHLADELEAHSAALVELADQETGLGASRLSGEVARMAAQLRFYGDVAQEGSYLGLTVQEPAGAFPRMVRVNRPLGLVAVFGASNFPFAFGTLGNDTGSAIAAGCPVLVKAHPAHIRLSIRLAELAAKALHEVGAPVGTLALVIGQNPGSQLVEAPEVSAVAFTGSQSGGLALWRLANQRDVVIPVFAEMGTVNPVVVTPAGASDMASVAEGFVGSFTLGSGQFCTKPGLLLAPAGSNAAEHVARALEVASPRPLMLTERIAQSVNAGLAELQSTGADLVAHVPAEGTGWAAPAAVLSAPIDALEPGSRLLAECFGAVAVVCEYQDGDQLARTIRHLQGALAASVITGGPDDPHGRTVHQLLESKVGRVVVDAWPTGVAFNWAQQHGGPWPSTSNPATTSVGAAGLDRFVRPLAYQGTPDRWLPAEAQEANPYGIPRRVDGHLAQTRGADSEER